MSKQFRLWAMCCSHVGTDLGFGRENLADAIRQSEQGGEEGGPPFDWDVAVVLGDHSGGVRLLRRMRMVGRSSGSMV